MIFINPTVELIEEKNPFKKIELAGRTCYKSENKITEDSAVGFVNRLVNAGHLAMVEHAVFCFMTETDDKDLLKDLVDNYSVFPFTNFTTQEITDDNFRIIFSANLRALIENNLAYVVNDKIDFDSQLLTDFRLVDFDNDVKNKTTIEKLNHRYTTMRFICDRGVSHELVRHRPYSFAQECVSGDTVINKNGLTIKELYDRKSNHYGKTHNKTIWLRSIDENNGIIPNKMVDVWQAGEKDIYEVKTRLGYTIKCTLNHKLYHAGKFTELCELHEGDKIGVNGRPSKVKITDNKLVEMYQTLSVTEIADLIGCERNSVIRKLKQLGVYEYRKNANNNPSKYNRNHTKESWEKLRQSMIKQFSEGSRKVWNKGLTKETDSRVAYSVEAMRAKAYKNPCGEKNSNWKDGINAYRRMKENIDSCELCGDAFSSANFPEVHHVDGNRHNNDENNLIKLCVPCHKMVHSTKYYNGVKMVYDEIVSIKYIGKEMTYDIEMTTPYNNYVANGIIVHNSQRYVKYDKNDDIEFIKPRDFDTWDDLSKMVFKAAISDAEKKYKLLRSYGRTAQEARGILPNAIKTEIVVTGNELEWKHFFELRCDKAAHPDMQVVANMAKDLYDARYKFDV